MPEPRSILLGDDEPLFLTTMAKLLSRHGLDVRTASSAEEALRILAEVDPDVVIMDVKMPGRDGLSALREIKQLRPLTAVILLTGHGTVEMGQEAIRRDAFDFLAKPANVGRILEAIEEAIRSRKVAEEAARKEA